MTYKKWYPAAAVSAVVLGCGGSSDNGNRTQGSTGGTTSINTGVPMNTGGMVSTYYGIRLTGGAYANGGYGAAAGNDATGGAGNIYGTAGSTAQGSCTPGQDQTCNDDPTVSSLMGQCNSDPNYCDPACCVCNTGYVVNPRTGKCNTYEQTVCYSPDQNIDKAYVDRAIGCNCDPVANPGNYFFCGIDSSGLRVILYCSNTNNKWVSTTSTSCNNCCG